MRRVGLGIGLAVLCGIAACQLLLPDGMVVRGPILSSLLGRGIDAPSESVVQGRFRVAAGYAVELFAEGVPNARVMRFSPGGSLIVSQPRKGQLLHIHGDADGDGRSDGRNVLASGLDQPHGIDFLGDSIYVGETGAIARLPYFETAPDKISLSGEPVRIVTGLPAGGNHWSRTLRFGPDGGLYLHVGSSCNVCEEEDPRRATLMRFEPDGSDGEIFSAGLRNSVGFDWRPGTNELFATDNGRDLLGDDYPPCELNRLERGGFYGWPYANGDNRPDPDFGVGHEAEVARSIPPAHSFRAHNAPLGMTFIRHPSAPDNLRGAALVALHGSWNRSRLDGYKVVSLHWDERGQISERDFLTGFEVDEDVIGRPADVTEGPDGSIYVSDDYAGVIYRIRRGAPSAAGNSLLPADSPAVTTPTNPLSELPADRRGALVEAGEAVFAANACGTCHLAEEAVPGVVIKPLRDLSAKHSIEGLVQFLVTPTPPMPVFDLSDAEREALAVYLLDRHP